MNSRIFSAGDDIIEILSLQNTERNPFKIGMKLEADCIKDSRKLCVASIGDIIDNRVLVTFDGMDQSLNYWTDINSPYLHPINWHQRTNRQLSLPSGNYIFTLFCTLKCQETNYKPNKSSFSILQPASFRIHILLGDLSIETWRGCA